MARLGSLAAYRAQQRARAVGAGLVGGKLPDFPLFDLLGDSITNRTFAASADYTPDNGYLNFVRALSGQAFNALRANNFAVSGDTTGPSGAGPGMTTRLPSMMASSGTASIFLGGTNDVGQGWTVAQTTDNYAIILPALRDRYAVSFVLAVLPRDDQAASDQTAVRSRNAYLQAFCATSGGKLVYVDTFTPWYDPVTKGIKAGYASDGLHPSRLGAYVMAQAVWSAMQRYFGAFRFPLSGGSSDVFNSASNPTGNKLTNAVFAGAGSAGTGITGTPPSGWTVSTSQTGNTGTITISTVAATDALGDWVQLEWLNRVGSDETITLAQSVNLAGNAYAVGEKMRAGVEAILSNGAAVTGPWIRVQDVPGATGTVDYRDLTPESITTQGPVASDLLSMLTLPYTAAALTSGGTPRQAITLNVQALASASGGSSGRVRFRRPTLRRVP